jgi:hypothetical protein
LEGFKSNFGKALKSSLNGRLVSDNSFHVYDIQELYKMDQLMQARAIVVMSLF